MDDFEYSPYISPHVPPEDNCLSDNDLSRYCPLDNGRHALSPRHSIGNLERLTPELFVAILLYLDLQSMTDFRRVNQQAMAQVDSIPLYRLVIRHASAAVRGMLSIGSAKHNSIFELHEKLRKANCDVCGCFGGHLYLVTCKRVCFPFFTAEPSFLPLRASEIVRKFGLDPSTLHEISSIKSRPGCYSIIRKDRRHAATLFDHDSAKRAGSAAHGSESATEVLVTGRAAERRSEFEVKLLKYEMNGRWGRKPRLPRTQGPRDMKSANPLRFVAIVSFPYFSTQRRAAFDGVYCIGCRGEWRSPDLLRRRQFTTETLRDHMTQWGEVINGFHINSKNKWIPDTL